MATGYLLQDYPNPNFGQFGWPRKKVSGVIGVHTTESGVVFSGPDGGAENTAAYIRRRLDAGGYHSLADADSRIKLVHPRYAAWADTTNNAHAMSVSGAMNAARWRELTPERAAAITRNMAIAAAELVRDAIAAGLLAAPVPARRITAAEAIAGSKAGFYGHGETNPGRRYDPGQNFNWALFLQTYASAIGGGIAAQGSTTQEEDDMPYSPEDIKQFAHEGALRALNQDINNEVGGKSSTLGVVGAFDKAVQELKAMIRENGVNADVAWYGFDGQQPAEGRRTTTAATAAGYADALAGGVSKELALLRALVEELAVKQGVTIDYDAIAKAVVDEEARRLSASVTDGE